MTFLPEIAWPLAILGAWLAAEYINLRFKVPRISIYAAVGFLLSSSMGGVLPSTQTPPLLLLANIAFGLILFETGYRLNLRWLIYNPWIGIASLTESLLTFAAVYAVATWFDVSTSNALLLAALSIATSPAAVIRVINEQRSSGQVTERVLHLAALNCVWAVFVFKVVVGRVVFETSGNVWQAISTSSVVLVASSMCGVLWGVVIPASLRTIKRMSQDSTLAFALAVIVLVSLTHALKLSPLLATLAFGVTSRHRRIVLNPSQRGFGVLGDLLSVLLFVFVAAIPEWRLVTEVIALSVAIVFVRQLAKLIGIVALAKPSGISPKKGFLVSMAMMPISSFVILILEQTRNLGIHLIDQLMPLAGIVLLLELVGPVAVQTALTLARETVVKVEHG